MVKKPYNEIRKNCIWKCLVGDVLKCGKFAATVKVVAIFEAFGEFEKFVDSSKFAATFEIVRECGKFVATGKSGAIFESFSKFG